MAYWTTKANLSTPRNTASYTLLPNGKLLASGGFDNSNTALNSCELYDPAANTWTVTGTLSVAQYCHVTVLLNTGKVLLVGGQEWGTIFGTAELYDPATGVWTLTDSPNALLTAPAIWTLPSGKILMASGMGPGNVPSSTAEVYDPTTELWSYVTSPPEVHLDALFDLTGDGRALMIGDATATTNTIVAYTESSDTWASYSLMGHPMPNNGAGGNSTIRLTDGNVLVAGGLGSNGLVDASCYIFHQDMNTITQVGSTHIARNGANPFLQLNGKVLLVGGDNHSLSPSEVYTSVEEYDPATEAWSWSAATAIAHSRMAYDRIPSLNDGSILVAGGDTAGDGSGAIDVVELFNLGNVPMPIAFIQNVHGGMTNNTVKAYTVAATSAGNLLVVLIGGDSGTSSAHIASVVDNQSGSWMQCAGSLPAANAYRSETWYCTNCPAGVTTITVTMSATMVHFVGSVYEFSGASITTPFDTANAAVNTSAPFYGPILVPSAAGQVLVSCSYTGDQLFTGATAPWIGVADVTVNGFASAYYLNPAISSQQCHFEPAGTGISVVTGATFLVQTTGVSAKQKASMFFMID